MVERLKQMLIRHEGWRKMPYRCPAGRLTIGVGWNMESNQMPDDIASYLRFHGHITDEMIDRLLNISIEAATHHCRNIYPQFDSFSENRRFALIDFIFNVGVGTALKFVNTNKAIREGRWKDAANSIKKSLYFKQLGGDPPGADDGRLERPEEIARMIEEG
ncbi:MAG: glycoside hydrolase family protein [Candidatus Omnitrophica bacterium]|nr:glycoside hydrolase family protein [Candidatus Omnitrophota bacterium]